MKALLLQNCERSCRRAAKNIVIFYFSIPVAEKTAPSDTLKSLYNASKVLKQLKRVLINAESVANISRLNFLSKLLMHSYILLHTL
jgi:hypothetical protein